MTDREELEAFFSMHAGYVSVARRDHLRKAYERVVSDARAEGFAAARTRAAGRADHFATTYDSEDARDLAYSIRAMQDERVCPACQHPAHEGKACGVGLACVCRQDERAGGGQG